MSQIIYKKNLPTGEFITYDQKPDLKLYYLHQVHQNKIINLDTDNHHNGISADGVVTEAPQNLAIVTADCLPIVVIGEKGFSFLHAGWRGVKLHLVKNPKLKVIQPSYFFIGPHIGPCCFQVTPDFKENFPQSPFFTSLNGNLYFSLADELKQQISRYYPKAKIEFANICTCCQNEFHSFRRNGTTLRNWNVFKLK